MLSVWSPIWSPTLAHSTSVCAHVCNQAHLLKLMTYWLSRCFLVARGLAWYVVWSCLDVGDGTCASAGPEPPAAGDGNMRMLQLHITQFFLLSLLTWFLSYV